jgi:NADPH-dependent 2,4-dienoyl-CoA reductase/sulfur reductase-like enzyme
VRGRRLHVRTGAGPREALDYDSLVIGTGAEPVRPPLPGLELFGPADGVHVLHAGLPSWSGVFPLPLGL